MLWRNVDVFGGDASAAEVFEEVCDARLVQVHISVTGVARLDCVRNGQGFKKTGLKSYLTIFREA